MTGPLFHDRAEAGRRLGEKLQGYCLPDPVILALPRGGVPVAVEIAKALDAPLDLLLVRKLGAPGDPEVALGAVSDGSHPRTVINWEMVRVAGVGEAEIAATASREIAEIERRRKLWLDNKRPIDLKGRIVVVVDDGVATGASTRVALHAVRAGGAKWIVLAAPVGPGDVAQSLKEDCDETVFLATPESFVAVGPYYEDFHQLDDSEVHDLISPTGQMPEDFPPVMV
jgi:putative phosphoribosyl transferase